MQEIGIESSILKEILEGKKTIEVRHGKGKFLKFKVGDTIKLREDIWEKGEITKSIPNQGTIRITQISYFTSFREMLETLDYRVIIPSATTIDEATSVYRKFYTPEDEESYGVIALSFELM